jgi:hypothetical protein
LAGGVSWEGGFLISILIVVKMFVSSAAVLFHNSQKKKEMKISDIFYYRKMNESLVWKDVSASGSGWAAREIGEQNQMWFWCEFWCPVVDFPCSSAVSQVKKTKQTNGMILGVYHRSVKPVSNCFNDSARLHWLAFKAEFVCSM